MVASGSAKGQIGPVGRATIEVGSAEQSGALAITDHLLMRGRQMHVMSYLREYLFRDEQARQPVRTLSGGERNRLLLAKALAAPSNLLEPASVPGRSRLLPPGRQGLRRQDRAARRRPE